MKRKTLLDKKMQSMRSEHLGPHTEIDRYLTHLRGEGKEGAEMADELVSILVRLFRSEDGLKVLIFLEKSVLLSSVQNGSSDSALREANAVRNFVFNLRSIVANGKSS